MKWRQTDGKNGHDAACRVHYHDDNDGRIGDADMSKKISKRDGDAGARRIKIFTPLERAAVRQKTKGRCAYCGCTLDYKGGMTIDHIQPVAQGGSDKLENLLPACERCNKRKGASSIEVFRRHIRRTLETLARHDKTYQLAVDYGLVKPTPHPVVFYFESLTSDAWEALSPLQESIRKEAEQ
jgi:5-methylcytosine-specific restriction endonuclease McrA